jgi:hypothetical protein
VNLMGSSLWRRRQSPSRPGPSASRRRRRPLVGSDGRYAGRSPPDPRDHEPVAGMTRRGHHGLCGSRDPRCKHLPNRDGRLRASRGTPIGGQRDCALGRKLLPLRSRSPSRRSAPQTAFRVQAGVRAQVRSGPQLSGLRGPEHLLCAGMLEPPQITWDVLSMARRTIREPYIACCAPVDSQLPSLGELWSRSCR